MERERLLAAAASLELPVADGLTNAQLGQRIQNRRQQLESAIGPVLKRVQDLAAEAEQLYKGKPVPAALLKAREALEFAVAHAGTPQQLFTPEFLRRLEEVELELGELIREYHHPLPVGAGSLPVYPNLSIDEVPGTEGESSSGLLPGGEGQLDGILGMLDELAPNADVSGEHVSDAVPVSVSVSAADASASLGVVLPSSLIPTPPPAELLPLPPAELTLSPAELFPAPVSELLAESRDGLPVPLPASTVIASPPVVLETAAAFDAEAARVEIRRLVQQARDNGFYSIFYSLLPGQLEKFETPADFKKFLTDVIGHSESQFAFHAKIYPASNPKRMAGEKLVADLKTLLAKVSGEEAPAGTVTAARLAGETASGEKMAFDEKKSQADGARLAVGVLVPRSADPVFFEETFSRRFGAFLGNKAGRFRLVFYPLTSAGADSAVKQMRKERVSVILDSSSLRDPESATELLRILADFDNEAFSALYPFIARLTDASNVDALSGEEIRKIMAFMAAAFSRACAASCARRHDRSGRRPRGAQRELERKPAVGKNSP